MKKASLPVTGTTQLLEELSPYIPDEWMNQRWPKHSSHGRHYELSAAQLWRVHLLSLLTPVHSLNLLVKLLPGQMGWRKFARLHCTRRLPGVRMLHEFRDRVGVMGLRQINEEILRGLLKSFTPPVSVALIDATDLPASCYGFKKSGPILIRPRGRLWADGV